MTVSDDLATLLWVADAMADEWPRRFPDSGKTRKRVESAPAAARRIKAEIAQLVRSRDLYVGQRDEAKAEVARLRDGLRLLYEATRSYLRYPTLAGRHDTLITALRECDALLAEDGAVRDERCDKCGLPRDAHPGRLFCPAPGGAA